jgi:hypothetical protein
LVQVNRLDLFQGLQRVQQSVTQPLAAQVHVEEFRGMGEKRQALSG